MKSFIHKQLIPAALIVCFVTSSFVALSVPKKVHADGEAACKGGMVVAVGQLAWASIKGAVSAQTGTEGPLQRFLGNYKDAGDFINDCILQPLAQMMIVALIRNIGASTVKWVNTGFEGKPSFVTDFEGTLLDAADQAAGNFIESKTDLGFLCSPFAFQIRLALAMKYSKPFNEQIRCTLSDIEKNVSNFANNNGGSGWDNFLRVTTEPQNTKYGAFLIADSELAKRMANAVTTKKDRISLGQGFLDYETCDDPESDAEYNARIASVEEYGSTYVGEKIEVTTSVFDANNIGASPTVSTKFVDSTSKKKICKKSSVKTPGRVIADQLQSEFATGPIQRAVAQELDQVIAATMNQLAQKAIQGASGLLGLSKKKQSSGTSYIDQYRAKYYGQGTTASINEVGGAQSELDAYTVASYEEALALRDDPTNSDLQNIDRFTNTVAGTQIQAQQNQVGNTSTAYIGTVAENNIALGKVSIQSSTLNAASNGNDGIKQTGQYIKGAETDPNEAGGWWEIDLGGDKEIEKINIYSNPSPSASNGGLGTFSVEVRSSDGNATSYSGSSFSQNTSTGSLSGTIGRKGRYVRITRLASQTFCQDDYYGRTYSASSPCENQPHLAFAELEVIEKAGAGVSVTNNAAGGANGGTAPQTVTDSSTGTSTLSWNPALVSGVKVSGSSGINQEIKLSAVKSAPGLTVSIALYDSAGRNVPFANVFSNFDILRGPTGGSWSSSQSSITSSVGTLRIGLSIGQNSSFSFKLTGGKQTGAQKGNYSFISRVTDSTGTVLEDKTQRINFVVE